jgi:NADPH:quinone reductase
VGERVAYLSERGGYAEYVAASEAKVWRVPAGVADEAAASITCVGLTAWGLVRDSGIHSGQSALVHGASGGVGSILMQMLPLFGVEPVGLVSGDEKAAFVRSLGANEVIDRTKKDFDDHVAKFSRGIDVVFDCVGSAVLDLNLRLIRETGTWMYFGSTSGHASFPGMDVLMRRLNIRGFVVFEYFADPELWHDGTQALGNYLGKGSVKAAVSSVLELEAASLGHRMLEERKAPGKIVLSL